METCLFPGCGYRADFISKVHCRNEHGLEREAIIKKYGKDKGGLTTRSKMSLMKWIPTQEQVARAAAYGVEKVTLYNRAKLGWDEEKAITTPRMDRGEIGRRAAQNSDFNLKRRNI